MRTICINSYSEILDIVSHFKGGNLSDEFLFRGTSGKLLPSLSDKCSYESYFDLAYKENNLLNEFKEYSNLKYQFQNSNAIDWEIRIAAREHGIFSSLMDWSNDIKIALEFAIYNFEIKSIDYTNLWILNRSPFNCIDINEETSMSFSEIDEPYILNFNLDKTYSEAAYSRRKFIQGGFFFTQPYSEIITPLNQNSKVKEALAHIIIPKEAVSNIWQSLSKIIDLSKPAMLSSLYNNNSEVLDGICDKLNARYI